VKLLLVDAGNTAVKWTLTPVDRFEVGKVEVHPVEATEGWFPLLEKTVLKERPEEVLVSSVKPSLNELFKKLPAEVEVPGATQVARVMPTLYRTVETLGVDRLLNALGATCYADTFAVVSVGTAVVVDAVKNGIHQGGSIFLGPQKHLRCLHRSAEQLPQVGTEPLPPPGKTTAEALSSGVWWSLKYSVEGFLNLYRTLFGTKVAILTGGHSKTLLNLLKPEGYRLKHDPFLTFRGLYLYHLKTR